MNDGTRLAVAFVLLLFAGPVASGTAVADVERGEAEIEASAVAERPAELVYELSLLPDRPGDVRVTATAQLPSDTTSVTIVELPDGVEVVGANGFDRRGDRWEWDGTTASPSLEYVADVNRTNGAFGGYDAVDVGDWALVQEESVRAFAIWQSGTEGSAVGHRLTVDGEGVAGTELAYLGPVETRSWRAAGQEFRLILPRAVASEVDRSAIEDSLSTAATALDVGWAPARVNVFVATDPIRRGGLASPPTLDGAQRDVWVHADTRVRAPGNTWLHEYVHTRQRYRTSTEMAWIDEGSADYYAALLALQQGRANYASFRHEVATDEHSTAVLAEPERWSDSQVEYSKGRRVIAALDAEIRLATGGDASFEDVFTRMNEHEGELTFEAFADIVESVAGRSMDDWLDRYVRSSDVPSVPDDPALLVDDLDGDPDGDGIASAEEVDSETNPFAADTDGDGLDDRRELQELDTDPQAADTDGDGIADGAEVREIGSDPTVADTDDDGLDDGAEVRTHGSDPTAVDSDDDGLDDAREVELGTNPASEDSDGDGLVDAEEANLGTDPLSADTDGDGIHDGHEKERGTDPLSADTDGDGLEDGREASTFGLDPADEDSDGDGLPDGRELEIGTEPTNDDSDGDGLDDGEELDHGTDPLGSDTDDDGLLDWIEIQNGADPTVRDTDSDGLDDLREVRAYGSDPAAVDTDGDGLDDAREAELGTSPTRETGTLRLYLALFLEFLFDLLSDLWSRLF